VKLLIVDDQQSVHLYLEKALDLQALGFERVLHAENGAQAYRLILSSRPEIMVLDIQMPVLDGFGLLKKIKEEQAFMPKVLLLSAYGEFNYARQALQYGVADYILKPIDPKEFEEKLSALRDAILRENPSLLYAETRADSDEEIVRSIKGYIDKHYADDLSQEDVAQRFFINKFQVSRLFKQTLGINYQDYVISVRVKAAAQLLRDSDLKLYEIAERTGFGEPSYLSNVFKKFYGVSPREYRGGKES
jgi:YesN/AraC family two-component response regulator